MRLIYLKPYLKWCLIGIVSAAIGFGIGLAYPKFQPKRSVFVGEPPLSSADPMDDWKNYQNSSLTIMFQHPADWKIRGFAGDQENYHNNELTFTNFILENPDNSIFLIIKNSIDAAVDSCMVEQDSVESQLLNQKEFTKTIFISQCSEIDTKLISLINLDKKITLIFGYSVKNEIESKKIIDQILSTFKFTDQVQTMDCGGWDTAGEVVCECSGKLNKPSCPSNTVCDSGTYTCSGQCGNCCYNGIVDNYTIPRCLIP